MLYNLIKQLLKSVYNLNRKSENIDNKENDTESDDIEELEDTIDQIQQEDGEKLIDLPIAVFEISVLNNGNLAISCGWLEENDETAKTYGHMLGLLNKGAFKAEILKTLSSHIIQNADKATFIGKILQAWENILNNEPMKPSEVFNDEQNFTKQ